MISKARKRWILAGTILASAMGFIDGTAVGVALPAMQHDLGATIAGVQWIVEVYALFLGALMLVSGAFADLYGRRLIFITGTLLFTAASVWCGFAPDLAQVITARAVQGVGAALLTPSSLAIIGYCFDDSERGAAIGTWSSLTAIAGVIGPVLGGFFVDHGSWRWIFFLNVPFAIAVVAIALACIPESREREDARLDFIGAALATLGLGGIVFALVEASIRGWRGGVSVVFVAGLAIFAAFVVSQARVPNPMMPLGLYKSATFSGANALTFLLYGALSAALFYVPFNLINVQHYPATAAGAALLPSIGAIFFFARYFGSLVPRVGARRLLVAGPAIAGCGFLLYALPGVGGSYWTTFFPAALVLGIGMAITVSPLTTIVLQSAGRAYSGLASAINNTVSRVAGLIAVAALSLVLVAAAHAAAGRDVDPLSNLADPASVAAFLAGFRAVMIASAILAWLGALCSLLWIRSEAPG